MNATNTPDVTNESQALNGGSLNRVARCRWIYDEWHDYYDTSCGQAYCVSEGTPATNAYNFCPGCGGRICIRMQNSNADNDVSASTKTETRNRWVILGEQIARDIFAIGSGPEPCSRIQFMAGDHYTKERGQGGFCEAALAKAITDSLRVHMGA